MIWLHRFAKLVAAATFVLILAGGLVTTTGSGLAVQDWPTTQGHSILAFPRAGWVGPVAYQQLHRLTALAVALLAIALTAWIWFSDRRRWVKAVAVTGMAAVILQALVGGMTVLLGLPAVVSTFHAALAHLFFCTTVSLALVTSAGWLSGYRQTPRALAGDPRLDPDVITANRVAADHVLHRLAVVSVVLIYIEILLGAAMRHTGAGLSIPDYPLAFGRLIPPLDRMSGPVALHFLHRVWALVTTFGVLLTAARIWTNHPARRELVRPSALVTSLLIGEIALGGVAVLAGHNVAIELSLIAAGALILATAVVIALRAWRPLFGTDVEWLAERERLAGTVGIPRPSSASALAGTSRPVAEGHRG